MIARTSDGLEIYYEVRGNEQAGETLVFLNGLTQSTQSWALMLPSFEKAFRIILLDFIFQGQSSTESEWRDFDQHARDTRAVLLHVNAARVHMIGLSYGSLVAQHFAVNYPREIKTLTLISTFAHQTPYFEAIGNAWWKALESGGYNLLLDIMLPSVLSEGYFASPLVPIEEMKQARRDRSQPPEAIFSLMRATRELKDYRDELKKIEAPALVIQGERDLLLPVHLADEVHRNIAGSELKVIPHAGHTLNLEHTREVCAFITEFLSKHSNF